jgi:hypothetical protein
MKRKARVRCAQSAQGPQYNASPLSGVAPIDTPYSSSRRPALARIGPILNTKRERPK